MSIQRKIATGGASLLIALLAFTVSDESKNLLDNKQQGQDTQSTLQVNAIQPEKQDNNNIQQIQEQTDKVVLPVVPKEEVAHAETKEQPKAEPKMAEPAPTPKAEEQPLTSRSGRPTAVEKGNVIQGIATAYGATPLNGGEGTWKTATGTKPTEGRTVAVDPRMIPLGSTVVIECPSFPAVNGTYIAEDTGGAITNRRIDIFMDDSKRQKMLEFGVRDVKLTVIQK